MLKKWNDSVVFEEIFCLILLAISLTNWYFLSSMGLLLIVCLGVISIFYFNDFKYILPCILFFIFANGNGFEATQFPIAIGISAGLLIISMIIFTIKNGFHISKSKSSKGLFLLSISCILPILWHNIIPKGKEVFYAIYFCYLLYFIIYIVLASGLSKNSFRMLSITLGYVAILLSLECGLKVLELHQQRPEENILSFWYYMGWGLCNEAGIIMCVGLPFIFIQIVKSDMIYKVVFNFIKIGIVAFGMVLTTSRGTILIGTVELFLLFIWSVITSKKRIPILIFGCLAGGLLFIGLQYKFGIPKLISEFKTNVFYEGLGDNGRKEIWIRATTIWQQDFVRMTFGSGMVAEFFMNQSSVGYTEIYIVYHSTFFEALAAFGNLGIVFLGLHFIEKYKQVKQLDKCMIGILLIGYILVDIYGLIDNTYGMYYYMVPLVAIMACLDISSKEELYTLCF